MIIIEHEALLPDGTRCPWDERLRTVGAVCVPVKPERPERLYDGDTFVVDGKTFRVNFPDDDIGDPPWERDDTHGPVSEWAVRDKKPGELVLWGDALARQYYDMRAAVKLARTEWGHKTRKAAAEAAQEDYERLRRWCNDLWNYVGVVVTLVKDGKDVDDEACWGFESDSPDYLTETAYNHAKEILHRISHQNPCAL